MSRTRISPSSVSLIVIIIVGYVFYTSLTQISFGLSLAFLVILAVLIVVSITEVLRR